MSSASGTASLRCPAEAADRDPRFRAFFDYWLSKAPPGRLPGRQHIDPVEMKPFLPYVVLFDVVRPEGGGYRFRHRLIGTHAGVLFGAITPGSYADEFAYPEQYARQFLPEMKAIVETHAPDYAERTMPVMVENFIRFCRLKLPLAADGETVDIIIGLYIGMHPDGTLMDA